MLRLFNDFWSEERVQRYRSRALYIYSPIFKKGDSTDCYKYRSISLLPHAGKVYERILEKILRERVENILNEAQHEFRQGR